MDLQVQVDLIREEIDREIAELRRLREEFLLEENNLPVDESTNTNNENVEENESSNVLRQRQVTRNPLDASYDLLEQDLIYLRQTIDDVSKLVAEQEQKLSRIELYRTMAHNRMQRASSLVSNILHNRYTTTAAGAVVGASISGPVGFVMGTKIGALVALSGSALGALSMNIMRQRITETDESQNNDSVAYSQAML